MSLHDESQGLSLGEEENVEGGSLPSRSQAGGVTINKRRKTSACWRSFEELHRGPDSVQRAKCRKCGVILKCGSSLGTGSLLRHQSKCSSSDTTVVSPRSATRSGTFSHARFVELVIEAIVRHDLPFAFVEYEGIRVVFSYICSSLRLPCRNTVKARVLDMFESEKVQLQTLLSSVKGRISLTADLWQSVATDGYLTVTTHFVDSEWILQKKIISFCHMPPPHNGVALADKVFTLIGEWGIENKLFSITLDNASAMDSFVEKLKIKLNFRGLLLMDGRFFHVRCCAHILNLIVQDGLKEIDPSVAKIRECIKYIKGSEARRDKFLACVSEVGLGGSRKGLRQDVPTRWNSTYLMLDSALFYRHALENLGVSDTNFKLCPKAEEWDKMETINKFLGEFFDVTKLFSGTKYPTSNLFFPKVLIIQHSIEQAMKDDDSFMKRMGDEMDLKFKKYWSDYCTILGIAVVLDPRYKMEFVEWAYDILYGRDSSQLKDFSDTLSSLYGAYVESFNLHSSSYPTHQSSSQAQGKHSILEDFDVCYRSGPSSSLRSELSKYLDEARLDRSMELDILSWWKMEQHRYPILFHMARDVLTIPISTVASESAFSIGGRVLDQYRSSLLPDTVQALLCTRDWIFSKKEKESVSVDDLTEDIFHMTLFDRHDALEEQESFS